MRVAYLAPEFPGQTHTWMWRERTHLIELGIELPLVATRRPPERDRARHDWAAQAERDTFYLWPMPPIRLALAAIDLCTLHLPALLSMLALCRRLAADSGPPIKKTLPLVLPAWRLARWTKRQKIQHIHAATPAGCLITALLAKRLNPALTVDAAVNAKFEWWGGALNTKFAEADAVYVVTQWMLDEARELFPPEIFAKFHVARHGVDTRAWPARSAAPTGTPFRVISVGRLTDSKGHDDLLRAVATLKSQGRELTLEILGEGPQRAELEALITELGLKDTVTMPGSVAEHTVRERITAAHLFVCASHVEALGVVYMEAMTLGVPTIGTEADGPREIIEHDVSGLLVPVGDTEALASAIARVMDDPALADRLGRAGRARIESKFDSRNGAESIKLVIESLHQRPA